MRYLWAFPILWAAKHVAAQACGPGIGSCAEGLCCSPHGWCGTTSEHCGTSAPQQSSPDSTQTDRTQIGSVPYGTIINSCTAPGIIALTFDDGPWDYTTKLLDILSELSVKATFFVTGYAPNKGSISDETLPWGSIIRRMHDEGHHIASHGWSHASLTSVGSSMQHAEILNNEAALQSVLGFYPTYFRCPYLECDYYSGSLPLLGDYGYHVIGVNADTKDYMYDSPSEIHNAMDNFASQVSYDPGSDSYISLSHDIKHQTVVSLTRFMIETARERGYRLVTVGECLGDPESNWYRHEN